MNSNNQIKILFLAADPSEAGRLRLGQELRDIRERLQLAKERDKFVLESRESVRPGDITQAIFDIEPQIVHFSGHGTNTGGLCFENLQGKIQLVEPEALAALFELFSDQINCVVLNACHSEIQAKAIAEHIPFVIGMNKAISDKAAIAFVVGFYKALAAGRTVDQAYKFGCIEIRLEGIPQHLTPVIYQKLIQESLNTDPPKTDLNQPIQNQNKPKISLLRRQQILQELGDLQQQYQLLTEKLNYLQKASIIQTGAAINFQLQKEIEEINLQREEVIKRIEELENYLE